MKLKIINDTGELAKKARDEQVKITIARKVEKEQKRKQKTGQIPRQENDMKINITTPYTVMLRLY